MRNYLSEFLGTFILIFAGTGVVIVNQGHGGVVTLTGIALCWGMIVIATAYSFGDISGNHINPAVTLAFAADKRFPWREVPMYLLSQFFGALSASALLRSLFPENLTLGITQPSGSPMQSFILEVAVTFVLMMVILRVSSGAKEKGIPAGHRHRSHGCFSCLVWRAGERHQPESYPLPRSRHHFLQHDSSVDLSHRACDRSSGCGSCPQGDRRRGLTLRVVVCLTPRVTHWVNTLHPVPVRRSRLMLISASISADRSAERTLEELVVQLRDIGVDHLHVDATDPSIFDVVERIRRISAVPIDMHIMSGASWPRGLGLVPGQRALHEERLA